MKVIEEILKWTEKLPGWQSDAIRRIWIQNELGSEDEEELFQMLKSSCGLTAASTFIPKASRFTKDHIGSASVHGQTTYIEAMHSLKNVNAIKPNQKIEFGSSGITVVYGDNATGKSGYSRVLKKACRARGVEEIIYPDVYSANKVDITQSASFDVHIDSQPTEKLLWVDGKPAPECLANIAVFDAKAARVYVDEANEVSYSPYGLDVFAKLAALCQILRSKCIQERDNLPAHPAILAELVGLDKSIKKLTSKTKKEDIEKYARFENADEERLRELNKIVADYKANDPQKKAQSIRRQKSRVDQLRLDFYKLSAMLSSRSVRDLANLWKQQNAAIEASRLASEKAFSKEPLPETGKAVWRILFEAAQKFSENCAYPRDKYPVTGKDSRCVLCQQLLDEEAKDRLKRFWEFIEQDTAKVAKEKQLAFTNAYKPYKVLETNPLKRDPQIWDEIRDVSEQTALKIEECLASYDSRAKGILSAVTSDDWQNIPNLISYPAGEMSHVSKQFEKKAEKSDSLAQPEVQEKAEKEVKELTYSESVHKNKKTILDYVNTLVIKEKLDHCLKAVETTGITRKQSSLMQLALTKELESALEDEFNELGVEHLPLKLKKTGSFGSTYHQLKLPSESHDRIDLSEILSQGEHRIVAIASFLAELSTSKHKCGIVFDDPVCSLDHQWCEQVARRLVKEGLKRQVIIFTHDIAFLLEIVDEAKSQQVQLKMQTVYRINRETGLCRPNMPLHTMGTGELIGYLRNWHQELDKIYHKQGIDAYRAPMQDFYGLLRKTWERAIYEVLLNDVVQPFRQSIKTQQLQAVQIEKDDYIAIFNGMRKCSKWLAGHDRAPAMGAAISKPDDLAKDLEEIREFRARIEKRKRETQKHRSKALDTSSA